MIMNKFKIICAVSYAQNNEFWIKDEYEKLGYDAVVISTKLANRNAAKSLKGRILNNFISVCFGIKVYLKYKDEDVIIFWGFFEGLIFSILDLIYRKTKKSSKIVALHMLIINPNLIKRFIMKFFC